MHSPIDLATREVELVDTNATEELIRQLPSNPVAQMSINELIAYEELLAELEKRLQFSQT